MDQSHEREDKTEFKELNQVHVLLKSDMPLDVRRCPC